MASSVVGVDFGHQFSLVAAAGRGGVDVILNGNSNRQNPTMVGFNQSRTMGESASSTAASNYRSTITSMKRLVGLSYDDPRAQKEMALLPFECVKVPHASGHTDTIGIKISTADEEGTEQVIGVEHVAGMLVKHLGQIAAMKASQSSNDPAATPESCFPADWVLAIPGYYTDAQRRAFLTGCAVAGIPKIQRLIHETTATALAYGIFKDIRKEFANQDKPTNVMFIDMGASSYQVAIVGFEPGKLIVKTTHYDSDLGGRDFDIAIANWIADGFEAKYKKKISGPVRSNKKAWLKLLGVAEKAKKTLSPAGVKEARVNVECLMDDLDYGATLKTAEYEGMCAPLLARLKAPIERCLAETKMTPKDLLSVEIVGGATRVASVKRALASVLGLNPQSNANMGLSTTMNADEAVCRGAALQSAILSPRFKVMPYEIVEYQPYAIEISWDGGASADEDDDGAGEGGGAGGAANNSVIMFDRGSNFPVVRRVTLKRCGEFTINAGYKHPSDVFPEGAPTDIATFKITAPTDKGEVKVRVNVKQDVHGSVTLSSAQMVEEVEEEEVKDEEMKDADGNPVVPKEGGNGDEPMKEGGGEGKEGDAAATAAAKKKKIKKTNLPFEVHRPMEWSKVEMDAAYEIEVKMANHDRIVRETADKRNELESYLYEMRDKILGDLSSYATDEERAKFSSALETTENWLYEDGFDATKSVYADKLGEVHGLGDPIVRRKVEGSTRPNAVSSLQRTVERYKAWLNSTGGDEKYDHITLEDISKCHSKCDEIMAWMYDMLDKQGSLPMHSDPAVTTAQINAKTQELVSTVSPIMNKPKPKPKKEEKKEEPAAPAAAPPADAGAAGAASPEGGKENGSGPEPMETDGETKPVEPMEAELV